MSANECANCCNKFEVKKQKKGYNRYSLENIIPGTNTVAREAISSITGADFESHPTRQGYFLCPECWRTLTGVLKYRAYLSTFCDNTKPTSYIGLRAATEDTDWSVCKKQPCVTSTPVEPENQHVITEHNYIKREKNDEETPKSKGKLPLKMSSFPVGQKMNSKKWDPVVSAVKHRQYTRVYKQLFQATRGSKESLIRFIGMKIRKEVKDLKDTPLYSEATASNLSNFSWDTTIEKLAESAPLLHAALVNSIVDKNEDTLMTNRGVNLKFRLGTALSCLLYSRYPRRAKFIPAIYSAQLLKAGVKHELIRHLYHAGLCTSVRRSAAVLNKIGTDFDAAVKTFYKNGKVNVDEDETEDDDKSDDDEDEITDDGGDDDSDDDEINMENVDDENEEFDSGE
ncbi:hypothetical protein CHS0354_031720 [Potamilus streckersoni]|uniref:Uncharacterized protein n=1 Tax=Potamilus streckersoni TaxID=2493646 RepID=A0AAE0TBC7_9BIVA|nr:hypothetical protein CHS0354_031720 [Potamilus streckersoni]